MNIQKEVISFVCSDVRRRSPDTECSNNKSIGSAKSVRFGVDRWNRSSKSHRYEDWISTGYDESVAASGQSADTGAHPLMEGGGVRDR